MDWPTYLLQADARCGPNGYTSYMNKTIPYAAPDFSLVGHDNQRYSLAGFAGRWLVVYFYPKDDTPGCTVEACSIRDVNDELVVAGIAVVGISMDTPEEHRQFIAKYDLPYTLLSDPMGETIREYGAWGKKMFGREGILRKTFIIDPQGLVQKVYSRVTPAGHGQQILDDIQQLR